MPIFNDTDQKRNSLVGLTVGIIQIFYISILGILSNWEIIGDPMAYSIYHYLLLPSSILLCLVAPVAGFFYSYPEYTKPIKYSLITSIVLATIVSIGMQVSGAISVSEIFKYMFFISIFISTLSILFALVIGKNI
jgi:hypothetical protein